MIIDGGLIDASFGDDANRRRPAPRHRTVRFGQLTISALLTVHVMNKLVN